MTVRGLPGWVQQMEQRAGFQGLEPTSQMFLPPHQYMVYHGAEDIPPSPYPPTCLHLCPQLSDP